MIRRIAILVLSTFLVGSIVALYEAHPTYAVQQSQIQTPSLGSTQVREVLSTTIPLPTASETPTSPSAIKVDTNTMAVTMKTLADHFASINLKPGWIHLSNEFYSDSDKGAGVLPNGVEIPKAYINEVYYHLNNDKIAFEGVTFMKTLDGKIIQVSVLKNNVFKSLTYDMVDPVDPFTPELDGGVVHDFNKLLPTASKINIETTILDNQPVTLFDGIMIDDKPLKLDIYNQPITGMEKKAYFDVDGKLVQLDVYYFLQDGTQRLAGSSKHFIVESGIELPIEIQKYLQ